MTPAIGTLPESEWVVIRGDDNFFNFDVTGDIDAGDTVDFKAARSEALLATAPVITKARGNGIADIDTAQGKFQVQLEPADTATLEDKALFFECVLQKVDVGMFTTVARGTMRLIGA